MTEIQKGIFAPETTYEIKRNLTGEKKKSNLALRPEARSLFVEEKKPEPEIDFKQFIKKEEEEDKVDVVIKNEEMKEIVSELNKVKIERDQLRHENDLLRAYNSREDLITQYKNELIKLKAHHKEEISKLKIINDQSIQSLEREHKSILELEREAWKKQKQQQQELHRIEISNLEMQHKQQLDTIRKQIELEHNTIKDNMQNQIELNKLTNQVDHIMITMKGKFEGEMKERVRLVEKRELILEEEKRKLQLEKERIETDKKHIESDRKMYKEREDRIKKEIEEYRALYNKYKEYIDTNNEEKVKELFDSKEELSNEKVQLELERNEWEKTKKLYESQLNEEKKAILLERRLLEERKEVLDKQIENDLKSTNAKLVELNMKREELAKEEIDLQKQQLLFTNKEIQLKREYDELQLKVDKYCYDKRVLEGEKERLAKLAIQVKEESEIIYKYKSSIDDTKQMLEDYRNDIDIKEIILHKEKAKVKHDQHDIDLMQKALLNTRIQQLQSPLASRTSGSVNVGTPIASRMMTVRKVEVKDRFRANDFITDLQRTLGKQPEFSEYIAKEKDLLWKSKRSLNDRLPYSNLSSTARSSSKYDKKVSIDLH